MNSPPVVRPETVLLIPHKGDPKGLLSVGPYGDTPPRVYKSTAKKTPGFWLPLISTSNMGDKEKALVLTDLGDPYRPGLDQLTRCFLLRDRTARRSVEDLLSGDVPLSSWASFGTLVMLDAKGEEVYRGGP